MDLNKIESIFKEFCSEVGGNVIGSLKNRKAMVCVISEEEITGKELPPVIITPSLPSGKGHIIRLSIEDDNLLIQDINADLVDYKFILEQKIRIPLNKADILKDMLKVMIINITNKK